MNFFIVDRSLDHNPYVKDCNHCFFVTLDNVDSDKLFVEHLLEFLSRFSYYKYRYPIRKDIRYIVWDLYFVTEDKSIYPVVFLPYLYLDNKYNDQDKDRAVIFDDFIILWSLIERQKDKGIFMYLRENNLDPGFKD
jgi:hypothetical protein